MAFQTMVAKQHYNSSMAEEDGGGGGGGLPVAGSSSSSSSCSQVPSIDSDLCCREDGGGWDKESPGTTLSRGGGMTARTTTSNSGSGTTSGTRLPTPSERAQLRRSRPVDARCAGGGAGVGSRPFAGKPSGPPAERVDCLLKMFRAQHKFIPAGVNGSSGGRALCHSLSPFVAERRGLFVAWEVRQTLIREHLVLRISYGFYCCSIIVSQSARDARELLLLCCVKRSRSSKNIRTCAFLFLLTLTIYVEQLSCGGTP